MRKNGKDVKVQKMFNNFDKNLKISKRWVLVFGTFAILTFALTFGSVFALKVLVSQKNGSEISQGFGFEGVRSISVDNNKARVEIKLSGEVPEIFILREYLPEGLEVVNTSGVFEVSTRSVKWIYLKNLGQYKNLEFWYDVVARESGNYTIKGEIKIPYGDSFEIKPSEFYLDANENYGEISLANYERFAAKCRGVDL